MKQAVVVVRNPDKFNDLMFQKISSREIYKTVIEDSQEINKPISNISLERHVVEYVHPNNFLAVIKTISNEVNFESYTDIDTVDTVIRGWVSVNDKRYFYVLQYDPLIGLAKSYMKNVVNTLLYSIGKDVKERHDFWEALKNGNT